MIGLLPEINILLQQNPKWRSLIESCPGRVELGSANAGGSGLDDEKQFSIRHDLANLGFPRGNTGHSSALHSVGQVGSSIPPNPLNRSPQGAKEPPQPVGELLRYTG